MPSRTKSAAPAKTPAKTSAKTSPGSIPLRGVRLRPAPTTKTTATERKAAHRPSRVGPHRMQEFAGYVIVDPKGNAYPFTFSQRQSVAIRLYAEVDERPWDASRRAGFACVRVTVREDVPR